MGCPGLEGPSLFMGQPPPTVCGLHTPSFSAQTLRVVSVGRDVQGVCAENDLDGLFLNSFQSIQSSYPDSFLLVGTAHSSSGRGLCAWLRMSGRALDSVCLHVMVVGSRLTLYASGQESGQMWKSYPNPRRWGQHPGL